MSLLPPHKTFKIVIGTTFHYRFRWATEENKVQTPVNLTEFTGTLPITPAGALTPWLVLTNTPNENGSGLTFHGPTGLIDIVIGAKDTETIKWPMAAFHLFVMTAAPSETIPLLAGKFGVLTL